MNIQNKNKNNQSQFSLWNGEETKSDDERESLLICGLFTGWGVRRGEKECEKKKKKTGYLGLFTGSKKKGVCLHLKKKKNLGRKRVECRL